MDSIQDGLWIAAIGLAAGVTGGLAGIGGSLVMLPGLALIVGYDDEDGSAQHAFAAAAMIVNVLVAAPAALEHKRKGAVKRDIVRPMLISGAVAIVLGVLLSNRIEGEQLKLWLAGWVALYCVFNLARVAGLMRAHETDGQAPVWKLNITGTVMGFFGGLFGIGGGAVAVPLLQLFARVPLKRAVAASSTVMVLTAAVGATLKSMTLGEHGRTMAEVLALVVLLAPTAMGGAVIGARLTHALPTKAARIVISVVLLAAAVRMAGLIG